jgi:hypothetical protein
LKASRKPIKLAVLAGGAIRGGCGLAGQCHLPDRDPDTAGTLPAPFSNDAGGFNPIRICH